MNVYIHIYICTYCRDCLFNSQFDCSRVNGHSNILHGIYILHRDMHSNKLFGNCIVHRFKLFCFIFFIPIATNKKKVQYLVINLLESAQRIN